MRNLLYLALFWAGLIAAITLLVSSCAVYEYRPARGYHFTRPAPPPGHWRAPLLIKRHYHHIRPGHHGPWR